MQQPSVTPLTCCRVWTVGILTITLVINWQLPLILNKTYLRYDLLIGDY
jgi:hypothetical protein